jgi:TonB-linked SusC/RagA family outer membrane protein
MKFTAFIMLAFCIHVSATTLAQKVTLSEHKAPLEKVINEIKRQTGYSFFYNQDWLQQSQPVDVQVKNAPLETVLKACFANQPFDYAIVNKTIVLKPKPIQQGQEASNVAQLQRLKGVVTDTTGTPLIGATVTVTGSAKYHLFSDEKGAFEIPNIALGDTISISYVGFYKLVRTFQGGTELYFTLRRNTSLLDAVLVQAYGTTIRRTNIGAISTLTATQIEKQPVINIIDALEGQITGLNVRPTSGLPGSRTLLQVRGQNNLSNAPNSASVLNSYDQPLIIVDGVPMPLQNGTPLIGNSFANAQISQQTGLSSLNGINPLDIESISVLKDADATSIYGSQGSNGVVLITTKRGKAGADVLSGSFTQGYTKATTTTPMMNTQQYLSMRKEAIANDHVTANSNADADLLLFDQNKNTNWLKEFFGGTARYTDVHLNVSGGDITNSYLVSGGYTRNTYNYPGAMADNRYTLHTTYNHTSFDKKFKLDMGADYSYDANNNSGEPAGLLGFTLAPNFPDLLDANGNPLWSYKGFPFANTYLRNPLAYLKESALNSTRALNTHFFVSYKLLPSLTISLNAGYARQSEDFTFQLPKAAQYPAFQPTGSATFSFRNTDLINIVPQLNFEKQISQGKLTVLAGGTYKKNYGAGYSINGYGYTSDGLLNSISGASSSSATNTGSYYKYVDGFARINYNWSGKYILNLTGNHDGSSNFGPDKRYGNFGSAGLGWIVSEENWVKNKLPFLSFLKLAADYGTSGSDGVAPYQYQPNWSVASSYGYQGFTGYYPVNPLNPVYAWAVNKKFNEQVEFGLFHDQLVVNFTLYQNMATNQLVSYLEPIQTGFSSITGNAPYKVKNTGWEFTINSSGIKAGNFTWTSVINLSHNTNILASFPNIQSSPYASLYIVGKPVNIVQLVPFAGVDPQTGLYQFKKADGTLTSNANLTSGSNGVGGDETQLVDITPKLQGGFGNTFGYKGLSLYLFFNFSIQKGPNYLKSMYGSSITALPGSPNINAPSAIFGQEWKQPGDQATIQRFTEGFNAPGGYNVYFAANSFASSTGAYGDASYIRLKTASLSYKLPEKWSKRLALKNCSFYVSAQNLFLITGYKNADPESLSLYSLPPQKTIVAGITASL